MSSPAPAASRELLRDALVEIQHLRTRLGTLEAARREPVAVVGLACRFPGGADSADAYWDLLREGRDGIREIPSDRWDAELFYDPDSSGPNRMNTRWGGFIDGLDRFDAAFFGISPREAARMDPQQRLLLEVAWEALEDAGQSAAALPGAGVFLGVSSSDYSIQQLGQPVDDPFVLSGSAHSICAGRISYLLDLRGPSVALDTACSSSLVALHLAVASLRQRECDVALAGGVNALISPNVTSAFAKGGFMAPDGRCKSFDARADGYVRGEGCGLVVLKRLADAQRDGDRIWALVRGSAVNQDGRSTGLTAPNLTAQKAVLHAALEAAGVPARSISYVEAHGTGTPLGDPIEVEALADVFAPADEGWVCALGAVKTSIGHLEAAAGIAGVIKTVLALRHGEIPPNLHFQRLNPNVSLRGTPFEIPTVRRPWPRGAVPRRAGVSSFGFGGTNAHVVLEEAPAEAPRPAALPDGVPHLLPLSARCPAALRESARRHAEVLARPDLDPARLRDHCATAALRRAHHPHRLVALGDDAPALARQLAAFAAGEPAPELAHGLAPPQRVRRLAFVFSGQGAQEPGMGRALDAHETAFRQVLDRCDRLYRDRTGDGLREILFAPPECSRLACTELAQPALFALQVALAAQWQAWGVRPEAVVGHSLGEIAAAHVAGILPLDDAFDLILERARRLEAAAADAPGRMLAVDLPPDDACAWIARAGLAPRVALAATNAPAAVVLAGDRAPLETLARDLEAARVALRWLPVDYAFHTPRMDPAADGLRAVFAHLQPRDGTLPFFSTVAGECLPGTALDADYWARNVREPVRFAPALAALAAEGFDTFLELGAHPVLRLALDQTLRAAGLDAPRILPSLRRGRDERRTLRQTLAGLHAAGVPVDWHALHADAGSTRVVSLPPYPWQRQRHWIPIPPHPTTPLRQPDDSTRTPHPLLTHYVEVASDSAGSEDLRVWETDLSLGAQPDLADHRIGESAIFPAAGYADVCLGAAAEAFGGPGVRLEALRFERPLRIESEARRLQVVWSRRGTGPATLRVATRPGPDARWIVHATARALPLAPEEPDRVLLSGAQERCTREVEPDALYAALAAAGLEYGPRFRSVTRLRVGDDEACGELRAPAGAGHGVHPALLDAAFQVAAAAAAGRTGGDTHLPAGLASLRVHAVPRAGDAVGAWARLRPHAAAPASRPTLDVALVDPEDGRLYAEVTGLELAPLSPTLEAEPVEEIYEIRWKPAAPASSGDPAATGRRWILLRDRLGVGTELEAALRERGDACVVLEPDTVFAADGAGRYHVRPGSAEDIERALGEAFAEPGAPWAGVIHLWPIDSPPLSGIDPAGLWNGQTLGCLAALSVLQAVLRAGLRDAPRLWLVTRGVQRVSGDEELAVAQAPLWGLGRVVPHEHPEVEGRRVDLDPARPAAENAAALLAELLGEATEQEIAWRSGRRYVSRIVRHRAPERPAAAPVRADATYLVTGGLGGLGLVVARWFVERGARHLVLAGRRDPSGSAKEALESLRAAGAHVDVRLADVAAPPAVRALVAEIDRPEAPLRGVVHAAGVLDDGILLRLDRERFERVLRPKVLGAWALHEATQGRALDFCVYFSSAASLLGSPGQGNYSAANAFLDALAHARQREGLPAQSINWGPWAEAGMAAGRSVRGLPGLSPAQGLEALERVLAGGRAQSAVMRLDLRQWLQLFPAMLDVPLLAELAAEIERAPRRKSALRDELLAIGSPGARLERLNSFLRAEIARALGVAPVAIDAGQSLLDLGFDSLMMVELRNRIESALNLGLPTTLILSHPTLDELVPAVAHRMGLACEDAECDREAEDDVATLAALLEESGGLEAGGAPPQPPVDPVGGGAHG